MLETWVLSLGWEHPACHKATKPMCHNYWGYALGPVHSKHSFWSACGHIHKTRLMQCWIGTSHFCCRGGNWNNPNVRCKPGTEVAAPREIKTAPHPSHCREPRELGQHLLIAEHTEDRAVCLSAVHLGWKKQESMLGPSRCQGEFIARPNLGSVQKPLAKTTGKMWWSPARPCDDGCLPSSFAVNLGCLWWSLESGVGRRWGLGSEESLGFNSETYLFLRGCGRNQQGLDWEHKKEVEPPAPPPPTATAVMLSLGWSRYWSPLPYWTVTTTPLLCARPLAKDNIKLASVHGAS